VGSVQAVVTGAARFFELVMMTAATIAGVAFVLHVTTKFGAPTAVVAPDQRPQQ
jgi:hypothetical protein